jgi:hypothetical protein
MSKGLLVAHIMPEGDNIMHEIVSPTSEPLHKGIAVIYSNSTY